MRCLVGACLLFLMAGFMSSAQKTVGVGAGDAGVCPNSTALEMFKHQIAFERSEGVAWWRGLAVIHTDVWMRGGLTGFYIRERLYRMDPGMRDTYIFDEDGQHGGGSRPVDKNWQACIAGFAESDSAGGQVTTCKNTIDSRRIPAWRPSPNNAEKLRIARELRREIENAWGPMEKIVVRDFNLADNDLTMYFKTKEYEQYQGCWFRAMKTPHCGWHLFGQSPISGIRKSIFARPYVLK